MFPDSFQPGGELGACCSTALYCGPSNDRDTMHTVGKSVRIHCTNKTRTVLSLPILSHRAFLCLHAMPHQANVEFTMTTAKTHTHMFEVKTQPPELPP